VHAREYRKAKRFTDFAVQASRSGERGNRVKFFFIKVYGGMIGEEIFSPVTQFPTECLGERGNGNIMHIHRKTEQLGLSIFLNTLDNRLRAAMVGARSHLLLCVRNIVMIT
jgi:hypothetical protein